MARPQNLFERRHTLLCLASVLTLVGTTSATPARAAAAFDLTALTGLIAQRKSAEARFTEERFVSGFEGPLRASGTLSFSAPDRFARQTLEPQSESMSVEGNSVTFKRGKRSRQMALDAVPELTALVEAMRGTLNGNAATLQKHFNTQVEGNAGLWILTLTPRESRLSAQVRELKIAGVGGDLRSVELWLAGGDRSLMSITPLLPGTPAAAPGVAPFAAPPAVPAAAPAPSSK
jgi:outer membrane lipoprotein-sorting protein